MHQHDFSSEYKFATEKMKRTLQKNASRLCSLDNQFYKIFAKIINPLSHVVLVDVVRVDLYVETLNPVFNIFHQFHIYLEIREKIIHEWRISLKI